MSDKSIKRRKKRKKTTGIVILFIIGYLFLKPTINIISGGLKTTLPSEELLIESIEGQGFFIKDEKVFKSDVQGVFNKTVKEGERVSAGSEVANVDNLEDSTSLEREIVEIEQAILALEKSEDEVEEMASEGKDIGDLKREKIEEIQNKIINKDYGNINIDKEELSIYEQKENGGDSQDTLGSETIEALENRRDKIKAEINENNIRHYTKNAGIISYRIDNYEDVFKPKDFEKYTYKKLDSNDFQKIMNSKDKKQNSKENVSVDDPIYKLLDDFEWYIAIKIDDIEDIKDLDTNQAVRIKIDNEDFENKGIIVNTNKSKNTAVVIVKFDTMMHKYYDNRVGMIELIKSKTNSLKIPKNP